MNSSPSQLQMPANVDASPGNAGSAASGGAPGKSAAGQGFAHALATLRMPARDSSASLSKAQDAVPSAASQKPASAKPAGSAGKRDRATNGNALPLTALLLPLLQLPQVQQRSQQAGTASAPGSGKAPQASRHDLSQLSLAKLNDVLQMIDAKGGAARTTAGEQSWQSALDQLLMATTGGHASGPSTPTATPLASALFSQAGAGAAPADPGVLPAPASMPRSPAPPLMLGDPGFATALGSQVSWLAGTAGNHLAQLQLHPQQLGPMLVQVKVHGHQTEVLFQTQHAVVTQTLEASLPRLREMLAQGGQQVSVNIQQQAGGGSGQSGQGQQQSPQWSLPTGWGGLSAPMGEIGDGAAGASPLARWYSLRNTMVDTYV